MIEDVCYQIYLKWWDEFVEDLPIDKFIYIRTDPEVCKERIVKRSREGEDSIPLDYLKKCGQFHDDWLIENSKT